MHGNDKVMESLLRMWRAPEEDGIVFWEDVVKDQMGRSVEDDEE